MIVDWEAPSGSTGPEPVIVVVVIEAAPAVKTTVPPVFATGVRRDKVLVSA